MDKEIAGKAVPQHERAGRALAVGLLLVAALCVATVYSDLVLQGSWIAHNALPIGALTLFLLLVTTGNRLVGRFRPAWALSRAETLLIYAMLLVASGIPSVGFTLPALSVAVAPAYYHVAEDAVNSNTASWLRVEDPDAIREYFDGLDPGAALPWHAWAAPLIAWSLFAVLLYTAFLCVSLLLRRAWVEEERLSFPLVQVPLEIAGRSARPTGNPAFFRQPVAWLGIAVPAVLHTLNAVHTY